MCMLGMPIVEIESPEVGDKFRFPNGVIGEVVSTDYTGNDFTDYTFVMKFPYQEDKIYGVAYWSLVRSLVSKVKGE